MSILEEMNKNVLAGMPETDTTGIVQPGKDGEVAACGEAQERSAELPFECQSCEGNQIIERMRDKRRIRVFEDGKIEFSDPDGWDAYNCVYLCKDCRSMIEHEDLVYFKDRIHLGRWLSGDPEWELLEVTDASALTYIDVSALLDSSAKALKPGELPFLCPECGASELDQCWVSETPITLYQDGSAEEGSPTYDESHHHYQCRYCRCVLEDEWGMTITAETLVDYLKDYAVNAT